MHRPGSALRPGDRAVDFTRADQRGQPFSFFERRCGRPVLLMVSPVLNGPASAALGALAGRFPRDSGVGLAALRLDRAPPAAGLAAADGLAILDDDGVATAAYTGTRTPVGPLLFVLDPTLRVAAVLPVDGAPEALADAAADALDALPSRPARTVTSAAPVLIVPDAIGADLRGRLIETCEGYVRRSRRTGDEPSGRPASRREYPVEDSGLTRLLSDRIERRVLPEVARAFRYPIERFEAFRLVRQEAPGDAGRKRPRRDEKPGRRFTLMIELNTGEFEGGALRFPEFGPDLYAPPAGGAIVFSCIHLRERLDVASGRRYALVTFLHAAAPSRQSFF